MQVFNVQIFGTDAEIFMKMSCADKKKWIKEKTNQKDNTLIEDFLKTVKLGDAECDGCKKAKNEQPKTNTPEVTAATEPADITGNGSGASDKRRNKPTRD